MGAIYYFVESEHGRLRGSDFGEPDETEHVVELLEGNGHMILRVKLADSKKSCDLLFTDEQAVAFTDAAEGILLRLGLSLPGVRKRGRTS